MFYQKYFKPKTILWSLYFLFIAILFCLVLRLIFESVYTPLTQDEGVFLTIAKYLNIGQTPYRDIFDHKTPGIYFLLSIFLRLGITQIASLRILVILINLISAFFVFIIANKLKPNSGLFASLIFLYCGIFFQAYYLFSEVPMALCLLISFYLILFRKNYLSMILAGFFLGLALAFKQTAIVNFGIIILYLLLSNKKRQIGLFVIGVIICWLPIILYLVNKNILFLFYQQAIIYNFSSYPAESISLVLKKFWVLAKHTLPLWILSLIYFINFKKHQSGLFLLFCFTLIPIPILLVRHYEHYWIQILPFLSIAGAIFLREFIEHKVESPKYLAYKLAVFLIIIISFWGNFKLYNWFYLNEFKPELLEQIAVANRINEFSEINILAENQFASFHYLTNKNRLNKYLYITEINNQTEDAENKTIDRLSKTNNVLILWPENKDFAYAKKLQNYILQNYIESAKYEKLELVIYRKAISPQ